MSVDMKAAKMMRKCIGKLGTHLETLDCRASNDEILDVCSQVKQSPNGTMMIHFLQYKYVSFTVFFLLCVVGSSQRWVSIRVLFGIMFFMECKQEIWSVYCN